MGLMNVAKAVVAYKLVRHVMNGSRRRTTTTPMPTTGTTPSSELPPF